MKSKSSFQYQDQHDPAKGKVGSSKPGAVRMGAAMKAAKMPPHKSKKK